MPNQNKKTIHFTLGNHMHWTDMQWLWGYDVLPGSVHDMLHLCREANVKGNINFDAIGYEKMAAECPDALTEKITPTSETKSNTEPTTIPIRQYTLDDVWHGMTLGKNADKHPRTSRQCEHTILAAESLSAVASLFGRPYAQWDVYPTWELDEAWRELLSAQHHDNHECEGLCGHVGYTSMKRSKSLAYGIINRTLDGLANRMARKKSGPGTMLQPNLTGWIIKTDPDGKSPEPFTPGRTIPPFGYSATSESCSAETPQRKLVTKKTRHSITMTDGVVSCTVDRKTGYIIDLRTHGTHGSVVSSERPLLRFQSTHHGKELAYSKATVDVDRNPFSTPTITIRYQSDNPDSTVSATLSLTPEGNGIDVTCSYGIERPDPGLNNAFTIDHAASFNIIRTLADSPAAIHEVSGYEGGRRKYPKGDWMTSPQWFEELPQAFTSRSMVDLIDAKSTTGRGLLVLHDGAQQFFTGDGYIRQVICAYDPWDEEKYDSDHIMILRRFRFIPHSDTTNSQRVQLAGRFSESVSYDHMLSRRVSNEDCADIPPIFGPLSIENAPNVLATAFYRESMKHGENLPNWAGHKMFKQSEGACDHPFIIRLTEYDGEPAEVTLKLAGPVAAAAKTNLMGEVGQKDTAWLEIEHPSDPPEWLSPENNPIIINNQKLTWSQVSFKMRPHEIATIMADMTLGRKQWRNLDEKREVWSQIHG